MGIDVGFYVVVGDPVRRCYAHTKLEVSRDYPLHGKIKEVMAAVGHPLTSPISGHFGDHYEDVMEDAYGAPLKWVHASELAKLSKYASAEGYPGHDDAIFAFLKALDPSTKIVVYWH